ncbi:MAG TPA: hypothetical protein VFU17_03860 [Candidatus Limnocylindrales bacterium]|nr:hypothetical protein [Candidatus Limnocylindrales bacterium]
MTTAAAAKPGTAKRTPTTGRKATTTARRAPSRLTADDLQKLVGLLSGADSTELKLTVPPSSHRDTIRGLPIDPVETQPRQVYFFDTPDLALNKAGIVVRARRIAGGKGDTVIKLRPVVPSDLPAELRQDPSFNVEVDVLPGGYVCSASFKGRSTGADIWDTVRGGKPLRKLFSKQQRAFFKRYAPEGVELDTLVPLGPTFLLKGRFNAALGDGPKPAQRPMVAEMWLYPDGSRILELSTKCAPADAFAVAIETRAYLKSRGVTLTGVQQTKTRTALEFYAGEVPKPRSRARRAG